MNRDASGTYQPTLDQRIESEITHNKPVSGKLFA